jgi:hypothetical protein
MYGMNVVNILSPAADLTSNIAISEHVDLVGALDCEFLVHFGVVSTSAGTSSDDTFDLGVFLSATASSAAGTQVPFTYRYSGAIGTNTWTTWAASTVAFALTSAATGTLYLIHVDPAEAAGVVAGGRYAYLSMSPPDCDNSSVIVGMAAIVSPRHRQETYRSTTV